MADPIMVAIAGAVAGKTAEAVFAGGRRAYESLVGLVKRRFAGEPIAQAALEAAESDPEANTERLASALELVAQADPDFDRELRAAGESLFNVGPGSIVNSVSGSVAGDVFQIGSAGTVNVRDDRSRPSS